MAMLAALSLSYAPNLAPVQSAARAATPLMQVGSRPRAAAPAPAATWPLQGPEGLRT